MKFLLAFLFLTSFQAYSNTYAGLEFGKSQYVSNVTDKYNLKSSGNSYTFILGKSIMYIGFEGYLKQHNTQAKIIHNSVEYSRLQNAMSYGVSLRFNLEYTYFKVGYGLHSLKGIINDDSGNNVNDSKMNAIYDTGTSSTTSGIEYGVGLQYRFTKSFRMTLGYEFFGTGHSNEGIHQASTTLIFKMPDFEPSFTE